MASLIGLGRDVNRSPINPPIASGAPNIRRAYAIISFIIISAFYANDLPDQRRGAPAQE